TTVWETDFNLTLSGWPSPSQPGGFLSAAPTQLTSGVFRDSQVVLAVNDRCSTGSPPQATACIHLVKETDLGTATPILTDNGSTGKAVPPPTNSAMDAPVFRTGVDVFDASLAIDPYGNLFGSAAFSSSTLNPGMAVFGIRAPISLVSWFMQVSPIVRGPSRYNCFSGSNNLWGA